MPHHDHVAEVLLEWDWLPEAIVPFQDVHDSPRRGCQHPVHGEQGPVPPPLVVGGNAAVLNAQALQKWVEKGQVIRAPALFRAYVDGFIHRDQ